MAGSGDDIAVCTGECRTDMDCAERCSGNPKENPALRFYHDGRHGIVLFAGKCDNQESGGKTSSVILLIPQPGEYSFPSGHTLNGFTAATVLFLYYKKAGVFALLSAAAIAFSRMYLFVHYPTDILVGMLLGIADAAAMYFIVKMIQKKREERL